MRVALILCMLGAVLVVGNAATAGKAAERKELTTTLRKLQADLEALESKSDDQPEQAPAADGQTDSGEGGSDDNDADGPDDIALKTIEGLFYIQGQMQGCIQKLLHSDERSSMAIQSRVKTGARPVDEMHVRTRGTFKDVVEPLRRRAAGATLDRLAHPMKGDRDDDGEQAVSPDMELGELIQLAQVAVIALDVRGG